MRDRGHVSRYYDEQVDHRLRGFIEGNERILSAWTTISLWAPQSPQKILDLGCGIGEMAWRMSSMWPDATITGVDISPESISVARRLFASPQVSFQVTTDLETLELPHQDLIVLVDVYEHLSDDDRLSLRRLIERVSTERTRIVLSFPSPAYQSWLREHRPSGLQPIDRDVSLDSVQELAHNLDLEVLLFQTIDVWLPGDYAHTVIGKVPFRGHKRSREIIWSQVAIGDKYSRDLASLRALVGTESEIHRSDGIRWLLRRPLAVWPVLRSYVRLVRGRRRRRRYVRQRLGEDFRSTPIG